MRHSETLLSTCLGSAQFHRSNPFNLFPLSPFLAHNLLFCFLEVSMLAEDTLLSSYFVEVSGWDEDESFFVEKSQLACDEFTGKLSLFNTTFLKALSSSCVFSTLPQSPSPMRLISSEMISKACINSAFYPHVRANSPRFTPSTRALFLPFRHNGPIRQ